MSRHNHLYNTAGWRRLRAAQLAEEPYCYRCAQMGRQTAANVADHIVRHNGDVDLFNDPDNLQSMCNGCHNSYKRRLEVSGKVDGCDVDGLPLDPRHRWKR